MKLLMRSQYMTLSFQKVTRSPKKIQSFMKAREWMITRRKKTNLMKQQMKQKMKQKMKQNSSRLVDDMSWLRARNSSLRMQAGDVVAAADAGGQFLAYGMVGVLGQSAPKVVEVEHRNGSEE